MSDYAQNEKDFQEKVFDYLDELREVGVTNMFGATPYITSVFGVDNFEANNLLKNWMKTSPRERNK